MLLPVSNPVLRSTVCPSSSFYRAVSSGREFFHALLNREHRSRVLLLLKLATGSCHWAAPGSSHRHAGSLIDLLSGTSVTLHAKPNTKAFGDVATSTVLPSNVIVMGV